MCYECEKVASELAEIHSALELAQDTILHVGTPDVSEDRLLNVMLRLEGLTAFKRLRFEDARFVSELRGKALYLLDYLDQMSFSRKLRDLQSKLRSLVSNEAWAVYLEIEELVNARMDRFSKNPPETSRELQKRVERS